MVLRVENVVQQLALAVIVAEIVHLAIKRVGVPFDRRMHSIQRLKHLIVLVRISIFVNIQVAGDNDGLGCRNVIGVNEVLYLLELQFSDIPRRAYFWVWRLIGLYVRSENVIAGTVLVDFNVDDTFLSSTITPQTRVAEDQLLAL